MKNDIQFVFKFKSYADALSWDAFEVLFWIGMIIFLFFLIAPIQIAVIAQTLGLFASLGIWASVIRKTVDPKNRGKNCWHDPEKE